jgi:hypothetical protein
MREETRKSANELDVDPDEDDYEEPYEEDQNEEI